MLYDIFMAIRVPPSLYMRTDSASPERMNLLFTNVIDTQLVARDKSRSFSIYLDFIAFIYADKYFVHICIWSPLDKGNGTNRYSNSVLICR